AVHGVDERAGGDVAGRAREAGEAVAVAGRGGRLGVGLRIGLGHPDDVPSRAGWIKDVAGSGGGSAWRSPWCLVEPDEPITAPPDPREPRTGRRDGRGRSADGYPPYAPTGEPRRRGARVEPPGVTLVFAPILQHVNE